MPLYVFIYDFFFFISVSRDGQDITGTEADFHKGHLLRDPECRAAHWLRHHPADHRVCWRDPAGLEGRETEEPQLESEIYFLIELLLFLLIQLGGNVNVK